MEGGRKGGRRFKVVIALTWKKKKQQQRWIQKKKNPKRYKPLSKIITSMQDSSLIPVGKFKYKLVYF